MALRSTTDTRPSTHRSIPIVARNDLEKSETNYLGQSEWVIKDPVSLKYFRLQAEQYELLQLLDGKISLDELHLEFQRKFPAQNQSRRQLQQSILDLYEKGLAWSARLGQGATLNYRGDQDRWQESKQTLTSLLYIRLPGFDPTNILYAGYWIARWWFHPAIMIWATVVVMYSWLFMIIHSNELLQRLPSIESLTTWQNTWSLWLVIGFTKIVHELGHGFACRHARGECHEIGVAFLIFSPCLYCDVSDSWTLKSKWKRIGIGLAGVYVELIMAALAFFVWWNSSPGIVHDISLLVFIVSNASTLLFNLNPLLRLDGYYVLSDWLEIPNLRQHSSKALDNLILKLFCGIPTEHDRIPQRRRMLFIAYALVSMIYRTMLVFVVVWMLFSVLKPIRLEYLGILIGMAGAMIGISIWFKRIVTRVRLSGDEIAVAKWRLPVIGSCFAALLAFFFLIPLPTSLRAPVQLEAADSQPLYATNSGTLVSINVRPGQSVAQGQLLMQFQDEETVLRLQQLLTDRDVLATELRKHQSLGDAKQTSIALVNLKSVEMQIADQQSQLLRLEVRAPCSGRIIEPSYRPPSPFSIRELSRWYGTPLESTNQGCRIETGTHLLSVAPNDQFRAVLVVSQLDIHALQVGQRVRMKLDHLPHAEFSGRIERIAESSTAELSDDQGRHEAFASVASSTAPAMYQAIVTVDNNDQRLIPGIHGRAKVAIESQTTAQWIWRNVNSTFKFNM